MSLAEYLHKTTTQREAIPIFRTEANRSALMAIYDGALRAWPVPFETFSLDTRYGRTHVVAAGDRAAPPLLMIHPMGVGAFVWSPIIEALSEGHRVFGLDTIGDIGRSELADPALYPKKGHQYSAWLDDVYGALNITRADVVAGSMGGWIAMNDAIYAPSHTSRLVLLGPMGLPSWPATLGVLGPMAWYALRPSPAKLERIITRCLGHGARANREFRPWMQLIGKCKPLVGQPLHISDAKLRAIKAPTLLFLGSEDGLIGNAPAAAKRARRNIAGCEVEIIPRGGHLMHVDEPELVGTRIKSFLEVKMR